VNAHRDLIISLAARASVRHPHQRGKEAIPGVLLWSLHQAVARDQHRSDLGGMLVLARAIWAYPSGSKELEDLDDVAVYRRCSWAQAAHG